MFKLNFIKKIYIFFYLCLFPVLITALPFNKNISSEDIAKVMSGKTIIRNVDNYKNLCITANNEGIKKAENVIYNLKPAYLAEIIKVIPIENNKSLDKEIQKLLVSISDYAGIPYYSEHGNKWYDLYSSAKILNKTITGNQTNITADLKMEPFGVINTDIVIIKNKNYTYYCSTNTNKMKYYDKFTCVYPENMKSVIILFKDNGNWILYGMGGVHALKVPFFDKRIETSFMNRIKTFCNYVFEKL